MVGHAGDGVDDFAFYSIFGGMVRDERLGVTGHVCKQLGDDAAGFVDLGSYRFAGVSQ